MKNFTLLILAFFPAGLFPRSFFIDLNGRIVIDNHIAWAHPFSSGRALAFMENSYAWGFLDRSGKIVIGPSKDPYSDFSEGLAAFFTSTRSPVTGTSYTVVTEKLRGFIDTNGKVQIAPAFTATRKFSEGLCAVYVGGEDGAEDGLHDGKWGYIDKSGKFVIPAKYDNASNFENGFASVNIGGSDKGIHGGFQGGHDFYINIRGLVVPRTVVDYQRSNQMGFVLTSVVRNGREYYGLRILSSGRTVSPIFDKIFPFSEGLALIITGAKGIVQPPYGSPIFEGGKYGFINKMGSFSIEPVFDAALPFSESLAVSYKGSACGYIDLFGHSNIEFKYRQCGSFSNGRASVFHPETGKCGYIDKMGTETVPLQYDECGNFENGLAVVRKLP